MPAVAKAQEGTGGSEGGHARHEVALLLAHTHVAEGVNAEGERTWRALPSFGLNYNLWLSSRWAVGLHTDVIVESFLVGENLRPDEDVTVERSYPVAPAVMATYRPHEHLAFTLGAGQEFAKEGNLPLMRGGLEYTIHLGGPWETSGSLAYDLRFDAYDSWTLGIGVTRTFR